MTTRFQDGLTPFDQGDYARAREIWLPLGEKGEAAAQCYLGLIAERENDHAAAEMWYRRAAEQGDALAQTSLGQWLLADQPAEALSWLEKAAANGQETAQTVLGTAYLYGESGLSRDEARGLDLLERAAAQDYPAAFAALGQYFNQPHSLARAEAYFSRGAELNDPVAQYHLALMCLSVDHEQAVLLLEKSARQGLTEAQYLLGALFFSSQIFAEADFVAAREWWEMAAAQGHQDAKYGLSLIFQRGLGVNPDMATTLDLWQALAKAGHPLAQCQLGVAYATGEHIARDEKAAKKWLTRAAKQGFAEAQFNLALLLRSDNAESARGWLEKAARQHYPPAQYNLGGCFERGLGGKMDMTQAIYWYEQAAHQNHRHAQMNLSAIYLAGKNGVPRDEDKARFWLEKAAAQGDPDAVKALAKLAR